MFGVFAYSSRALALVWTTNRVLSVMLALLARQLITGRARAHDAAKAMTQELRASEERYRRIVDTADEGIWTTDSQARISFVNPTMARLLAGRHSEFKLA